MTLSGSQKKCIQDAEQDLQSVARLIDQVFDQNVEDASTEDLNAIGRLTEALLQTSEQLKTVRGKEVD